MNNLFLFGIQGCGKGTQAAKLAAEFGYHLFTTGDELRKIAASGTELGNTVKSFIDAGNLVPLDIVMQVVKEAVKAYPDDALILFDGIPRDEDQMHMFNKALKETGRNFTCVHIVLDRDVAFERLLSRAATEGRTDDADAAVINKRMDTFVSKTLPVVDHYKQMGNMIEIDGEGAVDAVYERIKGSITAC